MNDILPFSLAFNKLVKYLIRIPKIKIEAGLQVKYATIEPILTRSKFITTKIWIRMRKVIRVIIWVYSGLIRPILLPSFMIKVSKLSSHSTHNFIVDRYDAWLIRPCFLFRLRQQSISCHTTLALIGLVVGQDVPSAIVIHHHHHHCTHQTVMFCTTILPLKVWYLWDVINLRYWTWDLCPCHLPSLLSYTR